MAYLDRTGFADQEGPAPALPDKLPLKVVRDALRQSGAAGHVSVSEARLGRGLLSADTVRSGYMPKHPRVDAVFNRALASICLALTTPIFVAVWTMLKLGGGGAVFYSGIRLGKSGETFRMLKFRTLQVDAQKSLSGGTLPNRSQLETRLGSYLRKSRIDELPQLINILKGDMVFFGPRPVRPELVPIYRAESDSFDRRFGVRPGLVGMTQALLPHSASKRLRGRFNAMCCDAPVRYGFLTGFVALVGVNVLRRAMSAIAEASRSAVTPLGRYTFLRSGFVRPKNVDALIDTSDGAQTGAVCAMSDEIVQLVLTRPVGTGPCNIVLSRKLRSGRVARIAIVARVEWVEPAGVGRSGFLAYATYAPRSSYQRYRLERYFLDQTVLPS